MGGGSVGGLEDLSSKELGDFVTQLLSRLDRTKLARTRTVEITNRQRKRWFLFGKLVPVKKDQMVYIIDRADYYLSMDGRLLKMKEIGFLSDISEEVDPCKLPNYALQDLTRTLAKLRR